MTAIFSIWNFGTTPVSVHVLQWILSKHLKIGYINISGSCKLQTNQNIK